MFYQTRKDNITVLKLINLFIPISRSHSNLFFRSQKVFSRVDFLYFWDYKQKTFTRSFT